MEARAAPHFHNEPGVAQLRIGVRKFKCIGALPPFDHPHVFIDMGESDEAICPYCATHFHYEERLSGLCHPPECAYRLEREVSFEGPRPANAAALAKPAVPPAPGGARAARAKARAGGANEIIASFAVKAMAVEAAARLQNNGLDKLQTYSPIDTEAVPKAASLSFLMLFWSLLGAAIGLAIEIYASVNGDQLAIGGRPKISSSSFLAIAFEFGLLFAVVSGFVGLFMTIGLPKLYAPIGASWRMKRDEWVVLVRGLDSKEAKCAREILSACGASEIEGRAQ